WPLSTRQYSDVPLRAAEVSAANLADTTPVLLNSSDVELGLWRWNTHLFTPVGSVEAATGHVVVTQDSNAVRVTPKRLATRNNAVNLHLARIIGRTRADVKASATAAITGGISNFGFVGITSVN